MSEQCLKTLKLWDVKYFIMNNGKLDLHKNGKGLSKVGIRIIKKFLIVFISFFKMPIRKLI